MKKIFTTISLAILATGISWGQGTENLMRMSSQNFSLGTARSSAMGGAFTSLGADVSSMSINPAGLGMYTRSEISISPGMRFGSTTSSYDGVAGYSNSTKESKSKATLGSFGAVYSNGRFALGIGSNRLADFSSKRTVYGANEGFSIGDMYAEQIYGIPEGNINSPDDDIYKAFFNYSPVLWEAIMGYQAALLNPGHDPDTYTMLGVLNSGDMVAPQFNRITNGAIDEYTISGAYNLNNILYFGLTVGIQDIFYKQFDRYSEVAAAGNTGTLHDFTYKNSLRMSGTGVNLKLGVTARPVSWFRVGLTYHSPTWMYMNEESFSDLTVYGSHYPSDARYGFSDTPLLVNDYNMRSPSRMMGGVSFTIINRIIVSADYERTWHGKMKYTSTLNDYGYRPETLSDAVDNYGNIALNIQTNGDIDLNNIITSSYRATNNFRVGIEAQPIDFFFIRAGYSYKQSPYSSDIITYNGKKASDYGSYQQFSGGLGYRNGRFSIDAAYVYGTTESLPYKFFDYTATDGYNVASEGYTTTKHKNSNVILTLGYRF